MTVQALLVRIHVLESNDARLRAMLRNVVDDLQLALSYGADPVDALDDVLTYIKDHFE